MPSIRQKVDIKKSRRKERSLQTVKRRNPLKNQKERHVEAKATLADCNITKLTTLESYKRCIAKICTEATSNPENGIQGVFVLFDLVAMQGGGTDELKAYVGTIALKSLVAVAIHLIPRISYELLEDEDVLASTEAAAKDSGTSKKKKDLPAATIKPVVSSNLVEAERLISKKTVELRDRLVDHCAKHLQSEPTTVIPLIARLTSADVKPHAKLLRLCVECCNLGYDELTQVCLDSIKEVVRHASITDLEKTLKVFFKEKGVHVGVLRIINDIPLAKRQHSFDLLNEKGAASNKHVEEILTSVISYYLRVLGQCKGEKLEECLNGLARFGVLVNEVLQKEILVKMRGILEKAHTLQPFTHVRMIQAATMLSRSLKVKSDWIIQEFTRMVHTTVPYLCQGQTLSEGESIQFSQPCHSRDIVRTVQVVVNHAISSIASSEIEDLVRLTQELLRLAVALDMAIGQAFLQEVCHVIDKVPQVGGILDTEGIIFSVLAKRTTSFWELELLLNHLSPNIANLAKELKGNAENDTMGRLKGVGNARNKTAKCASTDIASCAIDVHEILMVEECDIFSQYKPTDKPVNS